MKTGLVAVTLFSLAACNTENNAGVKQGSKYQATSCTQYFLGNHHFEDVTLSEDHVTEYNWAHRVKFSRNKLSDVIKNKKIVLPRDASAFIVKNQYAPQPLSGLETSPTYRKGLCELTTLISNLRRVRTKTKEERH